MAILLRIGTKCKKSSYILSVALSIHTKTLLFKAIYSFNKFVVSVVKVSVTAVCALVVSVVIAEDMDVSLRIVAAGYPVFQLKEEHTVYVSASDSFTHGDPNKITKELFYFRRIIQKKELKGKLPKRAVRYFFSQCYYHMAQQCFDSQKRWLTWKYSIKSFCLFPQGYDDNFRNNKILLVNCIYSIPMLGNVIKNFHQRNKYEM